MASELHGSIYSIIRWLRRGVCLTFIVTQIPNCIRLYTQVLQGLRCRGITRSSNNPVADYAERLVSEGLGTGPSEEIKPWIRWTGRTDGRSIRD